MNADPYPLPCMKKAYGKQNDTLKICRDSDAACVELPC